LSKRVLKSIISPVSIKCASPKGYWRVTQHILLVQ
jgi:hypothetical protein